MKKLIAIFITLVLICSLSISIVACKDGNQGKDALIGIWSDEYSRYEFFADGTGTYGINSHQTFNWGLASECPYKLIVNDSTGDFTTTKYYLYYSSDNPNAACRGFDIMTDTDGRKYINAVGKTGGKSSKLYKVS